MPKVSEFFGISIYIYFRKHPPPHFHARYGGSEALVSIDDLSVMEGSLPPRALGLVMEWASLHQKELVQAWRRAQAHEAPGKIDPQLRRMMLYRIEQAEVRPNYRLWVQFSDGTEGEVDLSGLVGKGVFAVWRDQSVFEAVSVDPESGTVVWPGDIDLAPDALYKDISSVATP